MAVTFAPETMDLETVRALLLALRAAVQARDALVDELDLIYAPPPSDDQLWEETKRAFLTTLPALFAEPRGPMH
jgi:hypothetical protein